MAKEVKAIEPAAVPVVQEPELPDELKFICALCKVAQNKSGSSSKCHELRIKGKFCDKLENLRVKLLTLELENENHRKYIYAFQKKPFWTLDEITKLYHDTLETRSLMSVDEFIDYCRTFGFVIV